MALNKQGGLFVQFTVYFLTLTNVLRKSPFHVHCSPFSKGLPAAV